MRERRYSEEEDPTTRAGNLAKKDLPCLRCGKTLKKTDRCHRICLPCQRVNNRGVNQYYDCVPKAKPSDRKISYQDEEDGSRKVGGRGGQAHNGFAELIRFIEDTELR